MPVVNENKKYPYAEPITQGLTEILDFLECKVIWYRSGVKSDVTKVNNFNLYIQGYKQGLLDEKCQRYINSLRHPELDDLVSDLHEYDEIIRRDWGRYHEDIEFFIYSTKVLLEYIKERISPS